MATAEEDDGDHLSNKLLTRSLSATNSTPASKRELYWKVERCNLLNIAKLCIKHLIESALELAKVINEDHEPFQQFFIVIESVFRHGLKRKYPGVCLNKLPQIWLSFPVLFV